MDTHTQDYNVTAFFDDRSEAHKAIGKLTDAGIPQGNIDIVEGNDPSASSEPARKDEGFFASLSNMFMGEEDRDTYAEGLRRGGYLVSVRTPAADQQRVVDILEEDGAVDMQERSEAWRAEGWSGGATGDAPATSGAPATGAASDGTIEVMKEDLRIGKRDVSHGRVRVRAHTVEEQVSEDVTLESETAHIERRPVDREIADADTAFQDRTIEVEETAEEAVVEKTARVVEEIDVGKTVERETETVTGTVRHTEVDVDDDRTARSGSKV